MEQEKNEEEAKKMREHLTEVERMRIEVIEKERKRVEDERLAKE